MGVQPIVVVRMGRSIGVRVRMCRPAGLESVRVRVPVSMIGVEADIDAVAPLCEFVEGVGDPRPHGPGDRAVGH
ncbi:MAG TPA: hypothetical protein VNP97_05570, partial [Microbacterium sp.]|nr:hypothetical protein [Microbacterium sp.]